MMFVSVTPFIVVLSEFNCDVIGCQTICHASRGKVRMYADCHMCGYCPSAVYSDPDVSHDR